MTAAATLLSLSAGFAAAYLLALIEMRGKGGFEGLINLPQLLLLLLFGRNGWLGGLLRLFVTLRGAVIATAVVGSKHFLTNKVDRSVTGLIANNNAAGRFSSRLVMWPWSSNRISASLALSQPSARSPSKC